MHGCGTAGTLVANGCPLGFCVTFVPVIGCLKDILDKSGLAVTLSFNCYMAFWNVNTKRLKKIDFSRFLAFSLSPEQAISYKQLVLISGIVSFIVSAANKRRFNWQRAEDLTLTSHAPAVRAETAKLF